MGWIAAAVAVVGGVIQSNSEKSKQKKAQKAQAEENQRASQWAAYRDEQARKWELQDFQRDQNYKEDSIRSFAQFAPTQELREMQGPERTQVDTSGLADFNPNDLHLNLANRRPAQGATATNGGGTRQPTRALNQLV